MQEELTTFVVASAPKNAVVKCRITRDRRGIHRGLYPTYFLHMEREDGRKTFLLAGRKRKKCLTSNYLITTDPTDLSRGGKASVANLVSNMLGTHFRLLCHSRTSFDQTAEGDVAAHVEYERNVLGLKGPRHITVIMPQPPTTDEKQAISVPTTTKRKASASSSSSPPMDMSGDEDSLLNLRSKSPVWSEESECYMLNFQGRVTLASVKNFQLIDSHSHIVMQCGRVAEDIFTMDYKHPMSALQAFAIALSSFDSKLACQ